MTDLSARNGMSKFDHNAQQKALIEEIMSLFSAIQKRMETDEEKQWLKEHCTNHLLLQMLDDMTVMTIHVLDTIGQLQPVNGITISKYMDIPKGTVSKITRRLVKHNLIITTSLPNNKKEVLFNLAPLGQELFKLHQNLHERIEVGINQLFQKYDVRELQLIVKFLRDGVTSPWIAPDPTDEDGQN